MREPPEALVVIVTSVLFGAHDEPVVRSRRAVRLVLTPEQRERLRFSTGESITDIVPEAGTDERRG